MNEDAMKYLCELSTHFHLETAEDWDTFFDLLSSIKNTGCAYPSVMKTASFPKAQLSTMYGTMYADTDSTISKMVTELRVSDVMRFTDDNQRVLITDKDSYSVEDALFFGEMQDVQLKMYSRKVSKFYSDYVYSENYIGSIIGIRLVNIEK